jgi:hypothetical protein
MQFRTKVNYRDIAEKHYGISVKGKHVHHKDGNCHNNDPDNLIICTAEERAEYHRKMGQESIASLLEGQLTDVNWHSIIGKLGAKASKGVKKTSYDMTEKAYKQRELARMLKRDPSETKLVLSGEDRTDGQKIGSKKAVDTKSKREKTSEEIAQQNEFRKKGCEAAKLALKGSKKLYNPITNEIKFAKPNSDKWFALINENYKVLSKE